MQVRLSDEALAKAKEQAAERGYTLTGDTGVVRVNGVVVQWEIRPWGGGNNVVNFDIVSKPWYLPENVINGWITQHLIGV